MPSNLTRRSALAIAAGAAMTGTAKGAAVTGAPRERVLGIGGFFFRAKEPRALAQWYFDKLGITITPGNYEDPPWRTEAGTTVFAPFRETTTYFGDMRLQWMINFRVASIDRIVAQLRTEGVAVELDPETYPNGRFAKIHDPEGNPIQLWQPGGKDPG